MGPWPALLPNAWPFRLHWPFILLGTLTSQCRMAHICISYDLAYGVGSYVYVLRLCMSMCSLRLLYLNKLSCGWIRVTTACGRQGQDLAVVISR